jgi:hypothetical protein
MLSFFFLRRFSEEHAYKLLSSSPMFQNVMKRTMWILPARFVFAFQMWFWKKLKFFCYKLIFFCIFRSFWCADINNNFKKIKIYIILIHFWVKNTLKINRNRTLNSLQLFKKLEHFALLSLGLSPLPWKVFN